MSLGRPHIIEQLPDVVPIARYGLLPPDTAVNVLAAALVYADDACPEIDSLANVASQAVAWLFEHGYTMVPLEELMPIVPAAPPTELTPAPEIPEPMTNVFDTLLAAQHESTQHEAVSA